MSRTGLVLSSVMAISAVIGSFTPPLYAQVEVTGGNAVDAGKIAASYLGSGILIGPDGREVSGKAVEFTLTNTGGSVILINRMYVKVLSKRPYVEYTFPRGPLAPVTKYKFSVVIGADSDEVPITDQLFSYQHGQTDAFAISVSARDKMLYTFSVVIEGFDAADRSRTFRKETEAYTLAFPEFITYMDVIRGAQSSVDIFLDGNSASELIGSSLPWLNSGPKVRLRLVTERDFYYRSGQFGIYLSESAQGDVRSTAGLIWQFGYDRVRCVRGACFEHSPYLIIDARKVLTNPTKYLLGNPTLIEDPATVREHAAHFASMWSTNPYLRRNDYLAAFAAGGSFEEMLKPVVNLHVLPDRTRMDEYAYLLRFNQSLEAVSALRSAIQADSPAVQAEARDSLEQLREAVERNSAMDNKVREAILAAIDRKSP